MSHLFCFGFGFSAQHLAQKLSQKGWVISATARSKNKMKLLKLHNINLQLFDGSNPLEELSDLQNSTHVLLSVPPGEDGDPVYNLHQNEISTIKDLKWIGYLSSTGVYGDTKGEIVDESAPLLAKTKQGLRRVNAERLWTILSVKKKLPMHIFRLAGIYGPGRSAIDKVHNGTARLIIKAGHLFSRVHVDDIVAVLEASMQKPRPGAVYNICDEEPAMSSDVVKYAAQLMNMQPPPSIPFDDGSVSSMVRSFYSEFRRVDNSLVKSELGVSFIYPNYREGLSAILTQNSNS
ncbi:MAG: NAD(P)-dependent oxidoreductase [Rhodospirillaceae bacterium]|nr:NAD(P)-dependent oxidoreductase [Rhodospirillaceae bacterium]|tara:strand:+ start:5761 stop:6633 length:873 start_codon:yes stop_codon:yes gene_type:complete